MSRWIVVALLVSVATQAFPRTHKASYNVPCTMVWQAVEDTIRNSGKYMAVSVSEADMTASYRIGSTLSSKRVNAVSLNAHGARCEMETQTAYSGLFNQDAGDFRRRVDLTLGKLEQEPPPIPGQESSPR